MSRYSSSQKRRRTDYLREIGRPVTVPAAPSIARVRSFQARGMSLAQQANATGLPFGTISSLINCGHKRTQRTNHDAIMMMRLEEPDDTSWIDKTGTIRRIQALRADGFPLHWLTTQEPSINRGQYQKIGSGSTLRVTGLTARRVRALYDSADGKRPADYGLDAAGSKASMTWASRRGFAPRHCWDPDTIDDPDAFPEWTGMCGTPQGWDIHKREGIPTCAQCKGHAHTRRTPVDTGRGQSMPGFSGKKLRALRERRDYGVTRLCQEAGVDKSTLIYWETGRSTPNWRSGKLDVVLAVLGANLNDVMEDE